MPKSKRARVVPSSKATKNRKELVRRLHSNVQTAVDSYQYAWIFDVQNMRNNIIKDVRVQFNDSRIFMGKTKVMIHALGATPETEYVEGSSGLTDYMSGEMGLLMTNRKLEEVEQFFAQFSAQDYARAGTQAEHSFVIPNGELRTYFGVEGGQDDPLPMSIEPTLRKLGVPTRIFQGKVVLEETADPDGMDVEGHVVCNKGDILDSRQTSLLKIFGVQMAEFRMRLVAVFDKAAGTVREVSQRIAR